MLFPRRAGSARSTAVAALVVATALVGTPSAVASSTSGVDEVTGTLVRAYDMDGRFDLENGPLDAGPAADGAHGGHVAHASHDPEPSPPSPADDPTAGLLAWVEDGRDTVRVPVEDVAAVPTGATVEVVVGEVVRDEAAADGLEPAREVLDTTVLAADPTSTPAGSDPGTGGTGGLYGGAPTLGALAPARHQVTVVMAVPAGGSRDGATLSQVVAAVSGPVSSFWSGQTGGAVTFEVAGQTDWIDLASGCDSPTAMWAEAARRSGFTQGANRHLVLYLGDRASTTPCSAGLATVGSSADAGGLSYVTSTSTSLIAHELGHNLGLYHSAKLRCAGVVESAGNAGCSVSEYLDLYDVMGGAWSQVGSLTAHQAHRLGALASSEGVDVIGAGGTFTLAPISARGRTRAVRLRDGAETYWLEYRSATGQDSWLSGSSNSIGLQSGVLVRREMAGPTNYSSLLLDPSPSASSGWARDYQAALGAGASTTLAGGRWRVVVDSLGSSARVTVAAAPGVNATPDSGLTGSPGGAPTPTAAVGRYDGASRYETAVAISTASHPSGAPLVVVASGEAFPDALAAGPVAARGGGPLLLVPRSGVVPPPVVTELRRLSPAAITLAGGTGAVDEGVADQLAAIAPVTRVSGVDRFDTAAALSESTGARGGTVFLASGATHADAVAGAALAAKLGGTVLLAGRDGLPAATSRALAALAPSTVVVLGGEASLGPAVGAGVAAAAPGAVVERRAGADRYDTANLVAERGYPDGARTVYLALGSAFPDALAGGPAAGAIGAPLLLTESGCVPAVTLSRIVALGAEEVVILGGSTVVTVDVESYRSC